MIYVVDARSTRHNVYVGRGSIWGNPYSHLENSNALYRVSTVEEAVRKYALYLEENDHLMRKIQYLRGLVLGCPCGGQWPCHAHILAALANEDYELPNYPGSI